VEEDELLSFNRSFSRNEDKLLGLWILAKIDYGIAVKNKRH
jgi:hypothetical protein